MFMNVFGVYKPYRNQQLQINLPILLTIFRVFLIPLMVLVYYQEHEWNFFITGAIFAIACVTDFFDGYLARKLGQTSRLGEILDPIADKLIIAVALMLIVNTEHLSYVTVPAMIIIAREITVSALREIMSRLSASSSIAVNFLGKVKTLFQMLAVGTLLALSPTSPIIFYYLGHFLFYTAAFLTVISMLLYIKLAFKVLLHVDSL